SNPGLETTKSIEPKPKTTLETPIPKPEPFKPKNPVIPENNEIDPLLESAIICIVDDRDIKKTSESFKESMVKFFETDNNDPSIDYKIVVQEYHDAIDALHESVTDHLNNHAQAIIRKLRFQHSLDKLEANTLFNLACQEITKTLPTKTPAESPPESLEEITHYLEYVKSQLKHGKEYNEIEDSLTKEYQINSDTTLKIYWLAQSNLSSNIIEDAINKTHELIEKNQQLGLNIHEITENIAAIFSRNIDLQQSELECFDLVDKYDSYRNPLFLQLHICSEYNIDLSAAEIIYDFSLNRLAPGVKVSDYYTIFNQAIEQGIKDHHLPTKELTEV
ncbi:MAG: hypothetical protein KUG73_04425, partial [Pseudomonadales bacterium]|nr:hypothetical protein [Pseudomonadales bacterium]